MRYEDTTVDRARGTTAVWVFFVITLIVSATIVYVIGDRLDNPDAAILTVLVPSTVAIGITAGTSGWIGVRSLLRLRGEGPGSVRVASPSPDYRAATRRSSQRSSSVWSGGYGITRRRSSRPGCLSTRRSGYSVSMCSLSAC